MSFRKYGNKRTTVSGLVFESKQEAKRYVELMTLQNAGLISNLQRQVKFLLIPKQRCPSGKTERACEYIADFTYFDSKGNAIVEDVKGVKTRDYVIKRKLMLQTHGVEITEITKNSKKSGRGKKTVD